VITSRLNGPSRGAEDEFGLPALHGLASLRHYFGPQSSKIVQLYDDETIGVNDVEEAQFPVLFDL
jgi:hypothetical protein